MKGGVHVSIRVIIARLIITARLLSLLAIAVMLIMKLIITVTMH